MRQYGGRAVWVHLPPEYDPDRAAPYPLLVLNDGQNLSASRPEAWGGSWRADDAVDRLIQDGRIPPIVLAGIDHAGDERITEFAVPSRLRWRTRRARRYAGLVRDEVIPGLARDFRVDVSRDGLGLGGSSMGALAALWMAALDPGQYGRLLVMSPSVWWRQGVVLRTLRRHPIDPATRVWVHAGIHEGPAVVSDSRALCDVLHGTGVRTLRYVEDEDGHHTEATWAGQLPEAIEWLYGEGGPASADRTTLDEDHDAATLTAGKG